MENTRQLLSGADQNGTNCPVTVGARYDEGIQSPG